jgi:hypothetical protein
MGCPSKATPNVSQLIDGGLHFEDVTDEELAAEQSSPIRLQMQKLVEASGLHRLVISFQNRNNNNEQFCS